MFSSIRKAKILIPFLNQRLGDYAQLARLELITFCDDMIRSIVGAAIGGAACLALLCFICVAVLVTEWDTTNRVLTAWVICGAWGILTAVCAHTAVKFMRNSSPFQNMGIEIARDVSVIVNPQDHAYDELDSTSGTATKNAN
jgi:hypothetical protein